jgi:hypothetical protein
VGSLPSGSATRRPPCGGLRAEHHLKAVQYDVVALLARYTTTRWTHRHPGDRRPSHDMGTHYRGGLCLRCGYVRAAPNSAPRAQYSPIDHPLERERGRPPPPCGVSTSVQEQMHQGYKSWKPAFVPLVKSLENFAKQVKSASPVARSQSRRSTGLSYAPK